MTEMVEGAGGRTVAVTGASGHLGRHVLAAFRSAGWTTQGFDTVGEPGTGVTEADLRDPAAARRLLAGASVVVHCAALPRPVGYAADDVFAANMALTHAAVSGAEEGGAERIVYASSFSVVGLPFAPVRPRLAALPLTEDEPAAPQDVYALTKWLGEEMLEAFVRRTGRSAVSLRLPWIHTPETFVEQVLPLQDSPESNLHLWSWIDARDAARGFVAAAEAEISGHARLYLAAKDSFSTRPSSDLAREGWPDVSLSRPLLGHESLIDADRARTVLGFESQHRWQDYEGVA